MSPAPHVAAEDRYARTTYRRVGRSGLVLPPLSLGLWQNFGDDRPYDAQRAVVLRAFDLGVTHLDLADNYGPPPGAAEATVGRLLRTDLARHRDELVIATKAGYRAWPGPYGEWGSRVSLLAALDRSLRALGTDHVDVVYSHRFDPSTPLEETMGALDTAVRSGRARWAGISSYSPADTRRAAAVCADLGTPLVVHQASYSMLNRWVESEGLLDVLDDLGMGCVGFSPLAQGMLTGKYLDGVPAGSRAERGTSLSTALLTDVALERVRALAAIARDRGQTLPQLALAWGLRDRRVASLVLGARSVAQLEENLAAVERLDLSPDEVAEIDRYAVDSHVDVWAASRGAQGPPRTPNR